MHHLILGYGYCGYHLAKTLLENNQEVTAISRHLAPQFKLSKLKHISFDLNASFTWNEQDTTIYYLIPPPSQGETDSFLDRFLNLSVINAKKVIYFGSSSVYGNHQGAWVDEQSTCIINNSRQLRRLDAEQQWRTYCEQQNIAPVLLRVSGIYGPHRLPVEAAKAQTPLIEKDKVPYTNHIYVKDLARITWLLSQSQNVQSLYNISDGNPKPMGTLQQLTANALDLAQAPFESWDKAWERASPMKREFMQDSKRLVIDRLKQSLRNDLLLTDVNDAMLQSLMAQK